MKLMPALLALYGLAAAADTPKIVKITAKKFSFEPDEIHLKKGEPVVLELKALDRTHGFKIKELDIRVDVTTSAVTRVPLMPDKEGTYTFACDVFCGIHHEDMNGTLIVEK